MCAAVWEKCIRSASEVLCSVYSTLSYFLCIALNLFSLQGVFLCLEEDDEAESERFQGFVLAASLYFFLPALHLLWSLTVARLVASMVPSIPDNKTTPSKNGWLLLRRNHALQRGNIQWRVVPRKCFFFLWFASEYDETCYPILLHWKANLGASCESWSFSKIEEGYYCAHGMMSMFNEIWPKLRDL